MAQHAGAEDRGFAVAGTARTHDGARQPAWLKATTDQVPAVCGRTPPSPCAQDIQPHRGEVRKTPIIASHFRARRHGPPDAFAPACAYGLGSRGSCTRGSSCPASWFSGLRRLLVNPGRPLSQTSGVSPRLMALFSFGRLRCFGGPRQRSGRRWVLILAMDPSRPSWCLTASNRGLNSVAVREHLAKQSHDDGIRCPVFRGQPRKSAVQVAVANRVCDLLLTRIVWALEDQRLVREDRIAGLATRASLAWSAPGGTCGAFVDLCVRCMFYHAAAMRGLWSRLPRDPHRSRP